MKLQTGIIILLCIILQTACDSDTEYFSIKNDDSITPIKIRGNTDSNVYIVYLTAPGGFEHNGQEGLLEELESQYGIVHYTFNRCENIGQNCSTSKFNYEQLCSDLDLVLRVLFERYSNEKSIFLLGYGLGANLILKYSDVGLYKERLNGIILNGAAYNLRNTIKASKTKFAELMQTELTYGDYEGVESLLEKLNTVDINTISPKDYYQLIDEQISDHIQDFSDGRIYYWRELNFNCNYAYFLNTFSLRLLGDYDTDLTSHIKNISLPVNLLWLEDEFHIPLTIGKELYDLLETPDKELHIFDSICTLFDNSRTGLVRQSNTIRDFEDVAEISAYSEKIIDFVEKYK